MKTLKNFDFGGSNRGSYDWDAILNGKINQMEAGKDFTCKPATLVSRARAVAKKRGLKIKSAMDKKTGHVVIQSYKA